MMDDEMNEPLFLYIGTADDCIPVPINGNKDRDALLAMAKQPNGQDLIWAWLQQHDTGELPIRRLIEYVDLELSDNESDALSGGNETVEIWKVPHA